MALRLAHSPVGGVLRTLLPAALRLRAPSATSRGWLAPPDE